jgi:hypothetical protein
MLDLESEGSSGECWGLTAAQMVAWIQDFSNEYHATQGVYPMFYTSPSWWIDCTGNSAVFASTNALVLARWSASPGTIPGGWSHQTIWQNADTYTYGGDSDIFNGSVADLQAFATNG